MTRLVNHALNQCNSYCCIKGSLGMKVLVIFFTVLILGCSTGRPANLGITDGKLLPCPDSPNCVSSQSQEKRHFIEPIRYEGDQQRAMNRLITVIKGMKRSKIETVTDVYVHAEFTSAVFRFVDDAEFYIDDNTKTIHMRSASRIGYSDLGVNRKRLEEIRSMFNAR
ncbi:MAG TPA: DUF1499 domain-containing protein [Syntrophales bacterium]|nr:DUF1499 domain-containing protein [Syntrophales bacterium]